MKHEAFNALVASATDHCKEVLCKKDKEYSSDEDRLHNFKVAGRMKGVDPIEALDGMWLKHRVSIQDMVDAMAANPNYIPDEELVLEKLGDNINYTLLLWALITERRLNRTAKVVTEPT